MGYSDVGKFQTGSATFRGGIDRRTGDARQPRLTHLDGQRIRHPMSQSERTATRTYRQKERQTLHQMANTEAKAAHKREMAKTKLQREQIKAENSIRRALGKQNIIIQSAASGVDKYRTVLLEQLVIVKTIWCYS